MFNTTITLFNRYRSKELGDIWYPHILHNVQLIKDKASITAKYGAESTDSASLIINSKNVNGNVYVNDILYIPPKMWAGQVNDDLPATLTFNDNAETFDFFVEGDVGMTEAIDDAEYKNGFYNYMNKKYDYCYAITKVGSGYTLIPHFEIMAK